MVNHQQVKRLAIIRRHKRVRARVMGTARRPRLSVHRSLRSVSVQLIDDQAKKTLVAVTEKELKGAKGTKTERALQVGKLAAEKAKALGISAVVFDRGGRVYHGRVAAVAQGAREAGLTF